MKAKAEPRAKGRPSSYTKDIAIEICSRITEGDSLRKITNDPEMPSLRTVMYWLNDKPDFLQQYTRAKEDQADTLADEILNISDTAIDAQLGRLRIDTRKWVASKLKPKKYGDKLDMTSDGKALPTPIIPLAELQKVRKEDANEI